MKVSLMYYYDMENPTIYRVNQKIYVKNNQNRYIVEPVKSIKELNEIYTILKNKEIGSQYYEFVLSKNGHLTMDHNGINYVLVKITNIPIKICDKIYTKINLSNSIYLLDRSNWYFLWSKKNDYIEYKKMHIENKFKSINESIDYYIGMAETAISYLNNNNNKTTENPQLLTVSHRRLNNAEINNPLNIIIDTKERDISEYLKYLFINQTYNAKLVRQVLSLEKEHNVLSYSKIYARLLYPNYYFDIYERVIEGTESEEIIQHLIKRIDEYEIYVRDIYNEIAKKIQIKKIDWL